MLQASSTFRSMQQQALVARAIPANRIYASWLAIAIIIVGALDSASTELALMTGFAVEANPIVAALQDLTGDYWILPKMLIHGWLAAGVAWFPNRLTLGVMTCIAALVFAVSISNLMIFQNAMSIA